MLRRLILAIAVMFAAITSTPASSSSRKHIVFDEKNTIILRGEVTAVSVAQVSAQLLTHEDDDVYLYLSSPGGSIDAGLQLIDVIKGSGKNVTCVAGFAASMAFAILQACDDRYVMDHSMIMQHVAAYGLQGQEPNNWSMAKLIHRLVKKMDKMQADRIGLSLKDFEAKTRNDWWLMGSDAVSEHAADETIDATCTKSVTAHHTKQTVQSMFFNIEVEWSGCPLVEGPLSAKAAQTQQGSGAKNDLEEQMDKLYMRTYFTKMFEKNESK